MPLGTSVRSSSLDDFSAFLPWPSPWLANRTEPRTGLRQVLGTRGGVVRNQDGFEVFYGVNKAAKAAAPAKPQNSTVHARDGFDVFFGIRARDRTRGSRQAPAQMSTRGSSAGVPELKVQQQQVECQLQARLARPLHSPDQTSRFVPVGRSVSDSAMLHHACGYETADLSVAQAAQNNVPSMLAVTEEEDEEDGRKELAEIVNLSDGQSASSLAPKSSQAAALSRQAQLVKGVEVFSMCGRPTSGLVPAGVMSFDLATPTPSFEPSVTPVPVIQSA